MYEEYHLGSGCQLDQREAAHLQRTNHSTVNRSLSFSRGQYHAIVIHVVAKMGVHANANVRSNWISVASFALYPDKTMFVGE
jgi:hypothetical protein